MPCSITNERCFITACHTSFDGEGEGDGTGEGEAEGECGTTCCESIALLGCGDITCLPLGAFVALSFFSSFNFPSALKYEDLLEGVAQLVVSCSNCDSLRLRMPVVPATRIVVEPEAISSMRCKRGYKGEYPYYWWVKRCAAQTNYD